ncbi:MAG: hypothetical protein COW66_05505 [Flavobacteriaceae bacterium CG18_big_fil_WC_8_21_14_2_50_34_36]|nr:helix-turn-helix domain-containing protein [Flavobacteriia bacterium]PIQ18616.1 MAG: hypothetical protein COW66_05505 [Flavobacteriaceae bacterium CG18_big_fil_WC_8_21_14_2_50_34_36]
MTENKKSYFAIIPANVRYNKNLCGNAKLLYGEITALCNEKGYCWANNYYFSELYEVDKRTIKRWLNDLIKEGFITSQIDQSAGNSRKIFIDEASGQKCPEVGTKMSRGWGQKCPEGRDKNVPHNNTMNNTMNRESSALNFLSVNFPSQYESFLIQHRSQIKDFEKFSLDFNDTCDMETIAYENKILFARLRKYARNWIQNQDKYNKPETKEPMPAYLRKIS